MPDRVRAALNKYDAVAKNHQIQQIIYTLSGSKNYGNIRTKLGL